MIEGKRKRKTKILKMAEVHRSFTDLVAELEKWVENCRSTCCHPFCVDSEMIEERLDDVRRGLSCYQRFHRRSVWLPLDEDAYNWFKRGFHYKGKLPLPSGGGEDTPFWGATPESEREKHFLW